MNELVLAITNYNLRAIIEQIGYFGVYFVIFAESGLLIGFFLPGDSLIFTAGFLASPHIGFFNITVLLIGSWIAAVLGDNVGYEFGKRVGHRIFNRENSLLFHKDHLAKAQKFYEKHGGKAIILARFMPVVRTFAPIVAGVGHMDHKRFTFFNCIGGALWVFGLGLAGFFLGSIIPDVDKYLLPIILIICVISILPPLVHFYKDNKTAVDKRLKQIVKL